MKLKIFFLFLTLTSLGCKLENKSIKTIETKKSEQYITVLGNPPSWAIPKTVIYCSDYYNGKSKKKSVVSLGLVDLNNQQKWLFEATPDLHT